MAELPKEYDARAAAQKWSKVWDESKVYTADADDDRPTFSVVIPPPNVTGSLHMGHALNNTLQDVLVRYKRMDGYNTLWVPGTDHAGIATQWVVRRQLQAQGIDFRDLGRDAFVEKVWTWKEEAGDTIVNQLQHLGVSCDWSRQRFTLDPDLQIAVTEHFVKLYEQGLIYRGQRLINWDPLDQTALSDLEVEQDEGVKGELWSFAYPIKEEDGGGEIVVATTRPETMLGDTAVAVHPDDPRYQHLIGKTLRHPFVDREIPIIADSVLVDMEFGTGCVKVTPAHDPNDFDVGKRHDLPMINILTLDGKLNEEGGRFAGMDRFDARKAVKQAIAELGLDRGGVEHIMNIPRSQRSGAIVEPMLSTQWFVRMKPLAGPALAAVERGYTRFVPTQWENTYFAWLREIRDWCISRQLWWGHRIPAWYAPDGTVYVARTFEEACEEAGRDDLVQDPDVLDTWFSSALWPFSVFGWPENTADLQRYYPTSVLITGFDIIFFWVARMMVAGLHLTGTVPFKDVYIHALVRDENNEKMSKTKGNVIDPLIVIDEWGADAFRFTLVALAAQGRDVRWDPARVSGYSKFTNKIWNALKFGFMNAEGYDPNGPMDDGPYELWIRARTGAAVQRVRDALDHYKFNEAASEIYNFVWGEYCDWYLELSKTTLYDDSASTARKNSTQHALFETMGAIVRLMHPIMPFLSEDIWSRLPNTEGLVTTARYPKSSDFPSDSQALVDIERLQQTVTEVRRIRGEMRLPKKVGLTLLVRDDGLYSGLYRHSRALAELAGVQLEQAESFPKAAAVAVVDGQECAIPLEGVIDVGAEIARLRKEIEKAEKDAGQLQKRLANKAFVANAKPEIVDGFRAKHAAAITRLDSLTASLGKLEAGA